MRDLQHGKDGSMSSNQPITYSPFAKVVGLTINSLDKEQSHCVLEVSERLLNVNGTVHGGAIYTLVDVGMGSALYAHMAENERCTTIENKINYLAAVNSGVLSCRSKVVHKTRRIAVLESEIECNGEPVARATGTFYVTQAKPD